MFDFMAVQKILKEDTETIIEASEEDITLYAKQLGIDVLKEKHLLWIARKGLETPIPLPWCPVEDEKGRIYYYNRATDKSTWEHPADDHFRQLVKEERDKQNTNKEDTELEIESEPSSLDDVPPITSGKNSVSAQVDENNLKSIGRKMGSLHKFHNDDKEEKSASTSYLKSKIIEDKFDSSFKNETRRMGRRSNYIDPLIKATNDKSLILNHSTDDDLSTGLQGIGFDRFAEHYGIMDASQLSPFLPSSQMSKDQPFIKLSSQPIHKSLLKTLLNTQNDIGESFSEPRKNSNLSFADFLKKAEEDSIKTNTQHENNLEEKSTTHYLSKSISSDSGASISINEGLEQEGIQSSTKKLTSIADDDDNKFRYDTLAIEDCWKRKLEEKEKEMRLDHEKHIAELQEKLVDEKRIEELKLRDAILLMKEENAVILSKQEQILTEELEADLESAKREIEMKKLATLQAIQDYEEKQTKEFEERKVGITQIFESKMQNLYSEMEKKLEETKQNIQHDHQKEIDNLIKEHTKHLEELKSNFQLTNDLKLSSEVAALKEELNTAKEQIENEKKSLEELQEAKLALEEHKTQLSEWLQEKEMLKHDNEEERNKLLQEKCFLQDQITEIKSEITEQNQVLQCLATSKYSLETEIALLKEEVIKQNSLLHQEHHLPVIISIDKSTDTSDLLLIDNDMTEKEKPKSNSTTNFNYKKESESANGHFLGYCAGENSKIPFEEEKMKTLEIKMDALEKALKLLEMKIGNTSDSRGLYPVNNKIPKTEEMCECCNKTIHTNCASGMLSNTQLFNSEELKSSPCLQNTSNNKYSIFYLPDDVDAQDYENNLVYNMYSKDWISQQEMNVALSPFYISESDTKLFPFSRSDSARWLEQCKEKFRNLQVKHETSQLNLELIRKEIFNNMSRKNADNNNEIQNLTYQQIPDPLYGAPQLENHYTQNILSQSAVTDVVTFPTNKPVQNDEHFNLWQNTQKLIQKEQQVEDEMYTTSFFAVKEKENNPLDQFLTLTETVLDKELELLSKDKTEKHYSPYCTLKERNSLYNFSESSFSKSNDSRKNVTYTELFANYKPMYIPRPTVIGELITEKEDWMEKIGSMYQKIRAYERDLTLQLSLKTKI